jgi:zinc protease
MSVSSSPSFRILGSLGAAGVLFVVCLTLPAVVPRAEGAQPSFNGAPLGSLRMSDTDSLPRDPALIVDTLPNGMRFYIRVNKSPSKRALLYLAVNAGSVLEDDDQQGFAHFLEHMAFNGTKHFPRHELISTLQLAGMRFGADINAETRFDETIYKLEVPTDDGRSLAQGLTMLQDWANGGMLIDSSEVLAERGVVMGEWRSRMADSGSQTVQAHVDSLLYGPDSRYRTRSPIGLTRLLTTAEPGPIRRFYKDWYRPDLMAVVAVGDFDPVQMKREIAARFSPIPRVTNPRPRVSPRMPSSAEAVVDVYRGMVSPEIEVLWKQPLRAITNTASYRQELVKQLLLEALQRRLEQLRMQPRRPFLYGSFGSLELPVRGSSATALAVVGWPTDSLEGGLAAALTEAERIAQHGVPEAVLTRQKLALLRHFESNAMEQTARPSEHYVDAYVDDFLQGGNGGRAQLSAQQELTLARALLPTITAADLMQAARFWRNGADRLTFVTFPKFAHERVPTVASITAIFDSVAGLRLSPDSSRSRPDGPLLSKLPTPGRVVREARAPSSGITEWTLSNGARVLFKPTRNDPDEILIRASSPGGSSLLPDSLFYSPGRMVAEMMTQAAGLGTHDRMSLEQQLSTTVVRQFEVEMTPIEQGMRLAGSPKDLTTLLQLLHLQFTAPKLDTAALNAWKQGGSAGGYSIDDQIALMLSGGNPRLARADWGIMQLADTGQSMAVYRDRFGNAGNFTFIIVGAATAQQVKPLVERYIASLPSTGKREQPKDLYVHPPDHLERRVDRVFAVPKASSTLLFGGGFPTAPDAYLAERRRLDALGWVLSLKFTDDLREQMGGTYGVGVRGWTLAVPQEQYRFAINFDAAPERMNGMLDTMFTILDTVRATGATPTELAKIAAMQRRARETALQDNHYWINTIELFDRLKIPFDRIVAPPQPTTAAEIRTAAHQYLPPHAYIHIIAMPQDSTLYTRVDSAGRVRGDSASAAPHATVRRFLAPNVHPRH